MTNIISPYHILAENARDAMKFPSKLCICDTTWHLQHNLNDIAISNYRFGYFNKKVNLCSFISNFYMATITAIRTIVTEICSENDYGKKLFSTETCKDGRNYRICSKVIISFFFIR